MSGDNSHVQLDQFHTEILLLKGITIRTMMSHFEKNTQLFKG